MPRPSPFLYTLLISGSLLLSDAWVVPRVLSRNGKLVLHQSSRFDELVDLDAGTETPAAVDDRYYSVPPTQPQLLANTKPRITLTRFLGNIVKEDPEVKRCGWSIFLVAMPPLTLPHHFIIVIAGT